MNLVLLRYFEERLRELVLWNRTAATIIKRFHHLINHRPSRRRSLIKNIHLLFINDERLLQLTPIYSAVRVCRALVNNQINQRSALLFG